jgi:hypothetical protein
MRAAEVERSTFAALAVLAELYEFGELKGNESLATILGWLRCI